MNSSVDSTSSTMTCRRRMPSTTGWNERNCLIAEGAGAISSSRVGVDTAPRIPLSSRRWIFDLSLDWRIMNTMIAASISAFGAADNFEIVRVPVPEPAANEVLVRVEVAGLIYADVQLRSGNYPIRDLPLPAIPGHEVVGVIESVGAEIEN